MVEQLQLAKVKGECVGPTGEVWPTQNIIVTQTADGPNVSCDVFTANNGACKDGQPCFFGNNSREQELIIRRETRAGLFVMDTSSGSVLVAPNLPEGHDPVPMTHASAIMLEILARSPGVVFDRLTLSEAYAPGSGMYGCDRVVDVHMSRIRRGLGEGRDTQFPTIIGVRSRGYKFVEPPVTS
jgi:DNA-binding winged helix-turn-helix (wHTH) protein